MAIIDLFVQKKGGVGKSVCAALLFQAIWEAGIGVVGVDTDPSNQSLAAYKNELNVSWLNIIGEGDEDIDKALYDSLISSICATESADSHIVIDVGASNFPAFRSYLKATAALDVLMEMGHEVRFHVVIAGGGDLMETCSCLKELARDFPAVGLIPWLNPFNGPIREIDSKKGEKEFMDFTVSREYGSRYLAVVELPDRCRNTLFRNDLQGHFGKFVTFNTAINSATNHIMVRQRLKMFWEETKAIIDAARLV